jgi:hypothetical protein
MFLLVPPRNEPELPQYPPEVVVDSFGAEVRFNAIPQCRIEWTQVRKVVVDVVNHGGGHAEGFWGLSGEGVEFGAPVEIVMGSDAFNARLFALPGFDMDAYRRSREAEAAGTAGHFVCWRATPGPIDETLPKKEGRP